MLKKLLILSAMAFVGLAVINPQISYAYNYGDYRSTTLVTKAWGALNEKDLEAVLAYTNKCLELYADQAKKMQESLVESPDGSKEEIAAYWALNDVATALFIQGEAYRDVRMTDEAKEAYQKIVDEYGYGQTWDDGGWFWKPAEAAKEKIALIESGGALDFGDYKSSTLVGKAWVALGQKDLESVEAYANKCLELYAAQAKEMQDALTEYPWESKEEIFKHWVLNDVGTALYIIGEANREAGKMEEARTAYQSLIDEFYYAQCWDPQGWFWKPAESAQQKIDELLEG
ncbi:MAG: tetratricopeptide repeat protein [Candidatus Omnitrophica bacterium]|nr:tetratricopeptide repeat protein [Candidatus Omnitrophota bacterium]